MLEDVEVSFDDISALVVLFVEGRRPATGGTSSLSVANLVGRLRDDCGNTAVAEVGSEASWVELLQRTNEKLRSWSETVREPSASNHPCVWSREVGA